MALALTVAAGAAQAGPYYLPFNHIQGMGDLQLPKHVAVYPPYVVVNPHLHIENGIEFGQFNAGDTFSAQGLITKGPKDVTGTSAAIGNTANVDVKGGVFVEGNQKNYASELAKQGALVLGAKDVQLTTAAIGNATNVTTKGDAAVDMNQINAYGRMDSRQISGVFSPYGYGLGDVEITSAAIGNSLSVEFGEHSEALVSSRQMNLNDATSINLAAVGGRFDSAEITSAAIGNALNITNVLDD
jgi:uncharacterized MnhB-related membrane protein